ncbi:hypothetical protein SADUNF_Sadunf10G0034500 [Salix dunnii]|uniref:Uncharacterized protein n=1 Tax=Salix dunnii TaxID=1413687 RepID=A0A835MNX5_9ROSI|nr:hypothetical protein SADUNF_Sadunf10G0034500 [Salix dunnii]
MFNLKHFLFQASYANIDRIKHIVIEHSRSEQLQFQEISFQEPSPQVKTQHDKFDGKNLITAKENKCLCMQQVGKRKKLVKNLAVNSRNLSTKTMLPNPSTFFSINTPHHSKNFFILVLRLSSGNHEDPKPYFGASRILPEELNEELNEELSLQSLQRGTVPPSEGSGCTNIPGRDGPSCP